MKHAQPLSSALTEQYERQYQGNALLKATANALSRNSISDISFDQSSLLEDRFKFSIDIPTLPATNQKSSGRCWIFAALNVFRERIAKACHLTSFELSQNYVAFWDKYEKINYFLESVIDRIEEAPDERTLCWVLDTGIQDGGQWDMVVNLVQKYGLVPMDAMPESHQSGHTAEMNQLINTKLRQSAAHLQALWQEKKNLDALQTAKQAMMGEFYAICRACFGEPPQHFDFEYVDKDNVYHVERNMTPQSFCETYIGAASLDAYLSIIHAPTHNKPFNQTYTVDYIGNVVGGKPVHYLNLSMEEMSNLIIQQLKDGEVVWFGSDVGHYRDRKSGIWNNHAFDYNTAFGMDFSLSKSDMLLYRHSAMTHAMVITGVNLDENGQPNRWKIQNSWGDDSGEKGYYLMNHGWFEQFVYQAVIHQKYLSDAQAAFLQTEPVHLDPWDPMGTLALCD